MLQNNKINKIKLKQIKALFKNNIYFNFSY